MKSSLILLLLLLSQNTFSGVGGSTGGDQRVKNPKNLEYYLNYSSFSFNLPTVDFDVQDAEKVILPINKVCIRNNDQLESINEVEITKLDRNSKPFEKIKELVRRDRKYLKKSIFLSVTKEVEIPRDYKIAIKFSASKGERLLREIDYSILDCE